MGKSDEKVLKEVLKFFNTIFVLKRKNKNYFYAEYKTEWLKKLNLLPNDPDEAKSSRTTKKLQEFLTNKFGDHVKIEAPVAEGMTLRFATGNVDSESVHIDSNKLQCFDVLDVETGTAFEISLADAFAEFFKDVLKALLDSRVKKLYICMRNHNYKGAGKSGYIKVRDSAMVQQYISLAKLYKLDILLIDLFPKCNKHKPNKR
ncbi:MAG TPA: hypothetical protein VNL73_07375 [Verrucomicrobiae bacterium]|nr:hypothetical protein [Verrucomicrobiae bacterium]